MHRNIKYGLIVGMFVKFGRLTSTVDIVDPWIPIPDRYRWLRQHTDKPSEQKNKKNTRQLLTSQIQTNPPRDHLLQKFLGYDL